VGSRLLIATTRDRRENRIRQETCFGIRQIQITPIDKNPWQNRIIGAAFQVAQSFQDLLQMSTATAVRTRKTRATTASLIATEFNTRQAKTPATTKSSTLSDGSIWDEEILPTPIESHPLTEKQTASPVILFLVAFVVVTVLVKLSIALILIAAKITKKIAHQVAAFWATQMGGEKVDFRVYQAIFD
jgi:hypothetical protein